MAAQLRDWVTRCGTKQLPRVNDVCSCGESTANAILDRLILDGLLAEEMTWKDDSHELVIHFPYQRFGDHLVSRHLLDQHNITQGSDEQELRRLFYSNRPLGKVFASDPWGRFRYPGIVSAIMLEFPERMKRSQLDKELVCYLPQRCKQVDALAQVFLEGLYWRSPDSFGPVTDKLVGFFLSSAGDVTRAETLEALSALAARATHPYNAQRLSGFLKRFDMATRDLVWSEFLRGVDEHAALVRLLSWIESEPTARLSIEDAANELRLLSLMLTTSDRLLRDRATQALVYLGSSHPGALFAEVLEGLEFPDPYVPERLLAAAYGVCMRDWATPNATELRHELPGFARELVRRMFLPQAPHGTKHILVRDYVW